MGRNPRLVKTKRIAKGGIPRVLDLFAGCGGFSLGFASSGFSIVGAVEFDPFAAQSHALNFFGNAASKHGQPRDITVTEPTEIIAELCNEEPETAIDVLIGGPPCQAFARVGRAKLREVAKHPTAFLRDPRSNLYLRFLHYVRQLRPLAIVLENVPDALNFGGHNIAEEVCEVLGDLGYKSRYTLLNSVFYGVPQMRERMFLIAYAEELAAEVSFPVPSNWIRLPRGYESTRSVALKTIAPSLFRDTFYVPSPSPTPALPPAVTAREALQDLPRITSHLNGHSVRGARRFNTLVPYLKNGALSEYARMMREWPAFENCSGVRDHVIRSLPRDYRIFRRMNPGDQYPEAFKHAAELFEQHLRTAAESGAEIEPGSKTYKRLRSEFVPPYDPNKFPNKWRKMEPDLPARTLMAHLGKDGYSHIHYDSEQARTISVREAARLQSFPDGFLFEGTMNPAFRQIGNAVPPLLAKQIAKEVLIRLQGKAR